jgi:hypothetical protein
VVIELDALDATGPLNAFAAVTIKVYEVPAVNPETVIGEDADEPVIPLGEEVAV